MENSTDEFPEVTSDYTSNDEIDFQSTESSLEDYGDRSSEGAHRGLFIYSSFIDIYSASSRKQLRVAR